MVVRRLRATYADSDADPETAGERQRARDAAQDRIKALTVELRRSQRTPTIAIECLDVNTGSCKISHVAWSNTARKARI